MTSWPRPHLEVPQNSKWPLWKENRILIKWSVILMATYKTGDLLRSIKFVCMSEGKAFKNYLLLGFFPAVPCNIILPNICELWLKSAILFLAENKREAGEEKKKSGANLSAQALIIGYRIFFSLHFRGEGFGGNVSPFRVRYLISIPRPIISQTFMQNCTREKNEVFG